MITSSFARRRITLTLAGALALASMLAVLAVSGTAASRASSEHEHRASVPVRTASAVAFHDRMRAL